MRFESVRKNDQEWMLDAFSCEDSDAVQHLVIFAVVVRLMREKGRLLD